MSEWISVDDKRMDFWFTFILVCLLTGFYFYLTFLILISGFGFCLKLLLMLIYCFIDGIWLYFVSSLWRVRK